MTHPLSHATPSTAELAAWRAPPPRVHPDAPRLTVHVAYSRAVLAYLRAQHADPAAVLAPEQLARIEPGEAGALGLDDFLAIIDSAARHLGDPDLAIKAAECAQAWDAGVVGYAMMTCPSVQEVGNLLVRFQRLLSNVYEVKAWQDGASFELRLEPATATACPALAAIMMGTWAWRARWCTGEPSLRFDASFAAPAPADTAAYERCFGGRVRFGQSSTAMQGAAHLLALPVRQHDALVNGVLRAQAAAEMERLDADAAGLIAVLRRRLRDALGKGPLTLDALAHELDLAPRTLQQRLEAQGLTFRVLLDGVRERRAKQCLADGRLNLTEIAHALGFANQSAFQHAFKRWAACSPGQWRRANGRNSG